MSLFKYGIAYLTMNCPITKPSAFDIIAIFAGLWIEPVSAVECAGPAGTFTMWTQGGRQRRRTMTVTPHYRPCWRVFCLRSAVRAQRYPALSAWAIALSQPSDRHVIQGGGWGSSLYCCLLKQAGICRIWWSWLRRAVLGELDATPPAAIWVGQIKSSARPRRRRSMPPGDRSIVGAQRGRQGDEPETGQCAERKGLSRRTGWRRRRRQRQASSLPGTSNAMIALAHRRPFQQQPPERAAILFSPLRCVHRVFRIACRTDVLSPGESWPVTLLPGASSTAGVARCAAASIAGPPGNPSPIILADLSCLADGVVHCTADDCIHWSLSNWQCRDNSNR